jgi:hypothetical protein
MPLICIMNMGIFSIKLIRIEEIETIRNNSQNNGIPLSSTFFIHAFLLILHEN